ncbi:VTT domain-containing protein [Paraburkholderia sp. MMS20-SJTR3]|uniref:VTT domain-containing protein n=1 Tax=Paraburkholderia sejongensis TaxID=2886946 RepID=A0ABS8JSR1_9BURK|nr:VTT domain-containing protein [Paraburkholderia sp. MMS20-SJTR3]MCC8392954.1 VTT domain-containing protein [Paraburkholderia sp. MMS20-SJTR3]
MLEFPTSAVASWGSAIVFANVLLTRLGLPIPAVPVLLFAGSAIAAGTLSFWPILGAAMLGALIGDGTWFAAGRLYGRTLLAWLGRLSPAVDAKLDLARSLFERYGVPLVSVSKFVPGLGLITPPLMGTTAVDVRLYALWEFASVLAWASVWLLGGAAIERELRMLREFVVARGGTLADMLVGVALLYLGYRLYLRHRQRRLLAMAAARRSAPMLGAPAPAPQRGSWPATPDESAPPATRPAAVPVAGRWGRFGPIGRIAPSRVLDTRPGAPLVELQRYFPGALALDPHSPEQLDGALRAHDVVIYCICPDHTTAAEVSQRMRGNGYTRIRALRGGLDAWQRRGFPVGLPAAANDATANQAAPWLRDATQGAVTLRGFAPRSGRRA